MANLNNLIEVVQLNNTADITHADVKSEYVDLAGYPGCILVACVGTMTGADASNYVVPIVRRAIPQKMLIFPPQRTLSQVRHSARWAATVRTT